MLVKYLNKLTNKFGYSLVSNQIGLPADLEGEKDFTGLYARCKPFTMTSPERMFSLFQSVKYVVDNRISGDFVECGVWKGGSAMLIALTLLQLNDTSRKIFLYDTYEGMSEPSEEDKSVAGAGARELLDKASKDDAGSIWCYSSLEEVTKNILGAGYPIDKIIFVKGKVEDTIPGVMPEQISLLRLDTDWYESTYHELKYLYPLLSAGGILLIDDFGFWQGAKKAVLEYFSKNNLYPLISRIDDTGRLILKTNAAVD